MKAYVYILLTKVGKYYVGSTVDLDKRFANHISGNTYSTKRMGVEHLVFYEQFATLKEARRIEGKLKKLKRKDYLEKIIKEGYIRLKP